MGLNAFYCGFIYNEWFAIGTNFFGSCYDLNNPVDINPPECSILSDCVIEAGNKYGCCKEQNIYGRERKVTATSEDRCTYPFGMDPAWSIADNKLEMQNGVKMKASVIFGVLHMSFGIFTKGMNLAYNRQWLEIFTEVVTGLIILIGLFGWMDLQIFLKWFANPDIDDISTLAYVN